MHAQLALRNVESEAESRSMRTRGKTNAFCRPSISIRAFARVYIIPWTYLYVLYIRIRVDIDVSNQFLYKFEFSNEYINERGIFLKIFLAKKITRLKNCVIFLLNIRGFDLIC